MPSLSANTKSPASEPDVTSSDIRPFSQSLPMLLMRAREAVMHRFRPHLRKHGMTEQQWRILRVLAERNEMEMLDLSVHCCIAPPSLSRTIPALVDRGLLERKANPNDQRRVVVSLSPSGRALFTTMSTESERIYKEIAGEIGSARMAKMYQVIEGILDILETGPRTAADD